MQWWSKWGKHTAELQLLRADAENRQKDGDDCYMLTKEDFTAVKDELAYDFVTMADEQLAVVRQLVAQLDDDRLDNQIQFESYERNWLRKEAAKNAVTINLSDEETSPKQRQEEDKAGESQTESKQVEQQPPILEAGQMPLKEQRSEEPEQQQQLEEQQQKQQQEPIPEEPLHTLEHNILDILDED